MNDTAAPDAVLPQPHMSRWQPLRVGLVELYHYDSEEFWFEDGHLMLRGNNGTGKSKVLSLTLPFLLDADLSPARLEPDADRGKRMDWNLLMGNRYDRRTGYTWIELGRVDDNGDPMYLTLGCGLRATAGRRSVDSWFFVTEQRVGVQLFLISEQQTALTRERLTEAVGSHAVFTAARDYRRAVDERLFGLGVERYRALIDTLIQLRQPQLSKQPNEQNLSDALSQAFPPLDRVVLEDVAEAMTQLDEYRDELDDYESMQKSVARFNHSYGQYARILARRRARLLRQAQTAFDSARTEARAASDRYAEAKQIVEAHEAELDDVGARLSETGGQIEAIKDSPEMRSARDLHRAQSDAERARRDAEAATDTRERAHKRHAQEAETVERRQQTSTAAREALAAAIDMQRETAQAAGLASAHNQTWGEAVTADAIAQKSAPARAAIKRAQEELAAQRKAQIGQIRKRLDATDAARQQHAQAASERDARFADSEAAETSVRETRQAQQAEAKAHIEAWREFIDNTADQLAARWPDVEETLADWVVSLDGASKLDQMLAEAEREQRAKLTNRDSDLRQQETTLQQELEALRAEQAGLAEGRQLEPPAPLTRTAERGSRTGAPLWQLLDFQAQTDATQRAGIEAALQASGVLDAWVTPAGSVLDPDTQDVWLVERPRQKHNLGDLLRIEIDSNNPRARAIDTERVAGVLAGIALGDDAATEFWLADDGRYRIGPSQGAWSKSEAEYIGFATREAARRRRLQALAAEIEALTAQLAELAKQRRELARRHQALDELMRERPGADALRQAHADQSAAERNAVGARQRLGEAEANLERARTAWERARQELEIDAQDTRLPAERAALETIAGHLADYRHEIVTTAAAVREHAQALAEQADQVTREQSARADLETATERALQQQQQATATRARYEELQSLVGASAEAVLARLATLEKRQTELKTTQDETRKQFVDAREKLGGARQHAQDSETRRQEQEQARLEAVTHFQAFAETGLLRAAVPDISPPEGDKAWAVDPALTSARNTEQALADVSAADEDWKRAQDRLGNEFTELQRAMSARGYASSGEPGDHGFVVRVVFNQRQEAPDRLQTLLESEITERRNLLTAKEREIIENHLQAEVAAQLQQLMREADERVRRINEELDQRPTSTGVKFKLVWQPRDDADSEQLTNLTDVRKRLLNKVTDAWSPEDRAAVGAFLQQRIQAERERGDGAARIDQLATALDYRAWHRFRVRRWQDGQWRPLSGPASSGERALGLTVPLFAAAASHYESAAAVAPRLVLLDEAFAGVDDAARAHCMDLIREFDLDFVMTSEREWGCYAELPGVSICHLIRREGVDAVFVSRWRWNGKVREAAPEPRHALEQVQQHAAQQHIAQADARSGTA
ncbi:MAG: TIGR02680 family protein [Nitrococcus sp.]|nr:TIGR02680 family protein [Nitrococcus sp.]